MKNSISARSPLSPKLWPPNAFVWWQSLLFILGLVASIIPVVLFLALLLMFGVAKPADLRSLSWQLLASQLAMYAAQGVLLFGVLPQLARRSLGELGWRRPRLSDAIWGIGGAVAMVVFASLAGVVEDSLFHVKADEVQVQMLRSAQGPALVMFTLLACLAAPVFEELTFRGFVLNALLRYLPAAGAVIVSGLIFGAVHWQPGNNGAIAPLMAGGIVLGLVYYRSGSLVASMITHALFNTFTVVLVIVFHQK